MKAERRQRLRKVIKLHDSWWTTVLPAHIANWFVAILSQTNVTPNHITLLSFLLAITAAFFFGSGRWILMAIGAIILQISFVFDCVDGQLARFKDLLSAKGAWLDTTTDVIKLFAIYFGLTLGAVRQSGISSQWGWGFLAYFLSNAGMFLYYVRPKRLKARPPQHDENFNFLERIYRFMLKHAYFLSFSVPDQLLLISVGTVLGLPSLLLRVLTVWGTVAISFSLMRTWLRLQKSS
jgi:phosphatidylglycerophosphate synthase